MRIVIRVPCDPFPFVGWDIWQKRSHFCLDAVCISLTDHRVLDSCGVSRAKHVSHSSSFQFCARSLPTPHPAFTCQGLCCHTRPLSSTLHYVSCRMRYLQRISVCYYYLYKDIYTIYYIYYLYYLYTICDCTI